MFSPLWMYLWKHAKLQIPHDSVKTSMWHLKCQTFQRRYECGPCQGFCQFFSERPVHTDLSPVTVYHWPEVTSFQLWKPVQFSSHSWVPTWVLPVPAVEKHPFLGQEHPAHLDSPKRDDSRAGYECEEWTINSTILMWLASAQITQSSSRLQGDTPILTFGLLSKYVAFLRLAYPGSQYKMHPRWLISEKCNIGSVIMSTGNIQNVYVPPQGPNLWNKHLFSCMPVGSCHREHYVL